VTDSGFNFLANRSRAVHAKFGWLMAQELENDASRRPRLSTMLQQVLVPYTDAA